MHDTRLPACHASGSCPHPAHPCSVCACRSMTGAVFSLYDFGVQSRVRCKGEVCASCFEWAEKYGDLKTEEELLKILREEHREMGYGGEDFMRSHPNTSLRIPTQLDRVVPCECTPDLTQMPSEVIREMVDQMLMIQSTEFPNDEEVRVLVLGVGGLMRASILKQKEWICTRLGFYAGGGQMLLYAQDRLTNPRTSTVLVEGVDFDPCVIRVAELFFGFKRSDTLHVEIGDAFQALERRRRLYQDVCALDPVTGLGVGPYHFICVDCFANNISLPAECRSVSFLRGMKSLLKPGGAVLLNIWAWIPSFTHVDAYSPTVEREFRETLDAYKRVFGDEQTTCRPVQLNYANHVICARRAV
mmetsp:Transcript_18474/g.52777  ORF Transcript_18474/g.52777 Transcript_18474/m.52777 type:complete len:358 (+) Transcript_18474:210-1283(+)